MSRNNGRQIADFQRSEAAREEFEELMTGNRSGSLFVSMTPDEFEDAIRKHEARYGQLSGAQYQQYAITLQRLQELDEEDYRDRVELAVEETEAAIREDKAHIRGYIIRGINPDTGKYFESLEAFESAVQLLGTLAPREQDIYASSHVLLDVELQKLAGKR